MPSILSCRRSPPGRARGGSRGAAGSPTPWRGSGVGLPSPLRDARGCRSRGSALPSCLSARTRARTPCRQTAGGRCVCGGAPSSCMSPRTRSRIPRRQTAGSRCVCLGALPSCISQRTRNRTSVEEFSPKSRAKGKTKRKGGAQGKGGKTLDPIMTLDPLGGANIVTTRTRSDGALRRELIR